ncbi:histidine permease [Delitschia confertaspora ATCC 74209]|uniref:Histidine permease n=1 Tax=Delitschia confertaspora ATCC 74209 TaxID=1513339 RepID=A0A9P4JKT3_9PLEO|nr:histidine permease [Delitschia confertaspora ATCC 74209]
MLEKVEGDPAGYPADSGALEKTPTVHSSNDVERADLDLDRSLKSHHLQLIAIGGTVGTGIFIASGGSIAQAGPGGALIAYAFIGTIVYSVMLSLSEMATYIPIAGAFTRYAGRFIDPSLGFAMGWIYWFSWSITYALELTAAGLIIQYWNQSLSIGIFIAIFWVPMTLMNFLPVNAFGELEFWFASIKVIALAGFMIFAICINAGASPQGYIGFKYYHNPGAFAPFLVGEGAKAKFVGFWATLIQAGFSFQGTETVGIGAGESADPRKTVPKAVRNTFWSIFMMFIMTIFFIGILVPYDNPGLNTGETNASASPLVVAIELAGVKVLPHIINGVLLTVVLSAASSNVYCGSRVLVGLSEEGCAPRFFQRVTKRGVPWVSTALTSAFGLLGFMNLSNNGGEVFDWFLNIIAVAGFIAWSCITMCHISFMRALKVRGISRDSLPYKSWGQPFLAWYGLFFCILIIITQGFTSFIPWNTTKFFISYISVILFAVLYLGHKIFTRSKFISPIAADIDTGRLHWEEDENPTENLMSETASRSDKIKKMVKNMFQ